VRGATPGEINALTPDPQSCSNRFLVVPIDQHVPQTTRGNSRFRHSRHMQHRLRCARRYLVVTMYAHQLFDEVDLADDISDANWALSPPTASTCRSPLWQAACRGVQDGFDDSRRSGMPENTLMRAARSKITGRLGRCAMEQASVTGPGLPPQMVSTSAVARSSAWR